jgi:hypothetical protein
MEGRREKNKPDNQRAYQEAREMSAWRLVREVNHDLENVKPGRFKGS